MQEELWSKLFSFIEENNLYDKLSDTTVTIYHDLIQKDKDFEIEVAVEIKEKYELEADVCYREIGPIDLAASVMCEGPYERVLPEGELLLAKWIEDNNYIIVGSERVYAYKHPYNEQDPNSFQTEIIFPIKEKEKR
jgi:effector-binding domain-containing protein